jgi:hypothetical protein
MISPEISDAAEEAREAAHIKQERRDMERCEEFVAEIKGRSPSHVRHLLAVAGRDADVFRSVSLALSVALGVNIPSWERAEMSRLIGYCAHVVLEDGDE